jgi:predicted ATPase
VYIIINTCQLCILFSLFSTTCLCNSHIHNFPYLSLTLAYELQPKEHRRKDHLRYGLAIYFDTLGDDNASNEQLFFTSITQINHGGPDIVDDPHKKSMIAGLNLKAGRLSIALSDYTTAFTLFEHGISYLGDDKWTSQYELSIDLFDSAAEAACALNKRSVVKSRVEEVVAHAKCFDDSLNCKYLLMLGYSCVTSCFFFLSNEQHDD